MAWVRLDDGFWRHPKILGLPPLALQLHIAGLCWSAEHSTDGLLTKSALVHIRALLGQRSGSRVAARLVVAGVWEVAADGSYRIHDYLDYNPSHEQVEQTRARWRGYKTRGDHSAVDSTVERGGYPQPFPRAPLPLPLKDKHSALPARRDYDDYPDPDDLLRSASERITGVGTDHPSRHKP